MCQIHDAGQLRRQSHHNWPAKENVGGGKPPSNPHRVKGRLEVKAYFLVSGCGGAVAGHQKGEYEQHLPLTLPFSDSLSER
jgi:hypothetical protein